jgi:hypothetical protein
VNDAKLRGELIARGLKRAREFTWERAGEELAEEILALDR